MSTATVEQAETASARKLTGNRARSAIRSAEASAANEAVVTSLVHNSVNTVRQLAPTAILRPADAVTFVFDLAQESLNVGRRFAMEIATMLESGIEAIERQAAA